MEAKTNGKSEIKDSASSMNKSISSVHIENPEIEYIWGFELTADKPTYTWNEKDADMEDDDEDFISHTVFIKLAILGEGAVPSETNIVQMESLGGNGKPVKVLIANLKEGVNSVGTLDLNISGRIGATFKLIAGSGPVCISGNHMMEYPKDDDLNDMSQTESELSANEDLENGLDDTKGEGEDDDVDEDEDEDEEDDDEDEDEDEEEEAEEKVSERNAKRKKTQAGGKAKQKAKMEVDEEEDEEDDDDEEDDEDYEVPEVKKPKKQAPAKRPAGTAAAAKTKGKAGKEDTKKTEKGKKKVGKKA